MDKIKKMFGNSPLEQRSEDAEKVKLLKQKIDQLVIDLGTKGKLGSDIQDIMNDSRLERISQENRKYATEQYSAMDRQLLFYKVKEEIKQLEIQKENLSKQVNVFLDHYKEDPSVTGPKASDTEKELKFLKGKLEGIGTHIKVLNGDARDKLFAQGAILPNGEPNPDYYATRKEIDAFKEEQEMTKAGISLYGEQAEWKAGDLENQEGDYFEAIKLAEMIENQIKDLSSNLDKQKAFIKYIQDKKVSVSFKGALSRLEALRHDLVNQVADINHIGADFHTQGVRVKYEDLKPYLTKKAE